MTAAAPRQTVAVVGGGFSGAVLAHQLARRAPGAFRIVVIEPRERLGAGVAYSTQDPAHRINVPSSRMSFISSDPCHFDRWLKADGALLDDPEAVTPDGRSFPRRTVFGRYAAETIEPLLISGEVEHTVARATSIARDGAQGYVITLTGGETFRADLVALAATHPSPDTLPAFADVTRDPRLIRDTQSQRALDVVTNDARVLIVGTGLTMGDIVASLDRRGHRGPIVAVSRRALLSRGHVPVAGEFGGFTDPPSRTAGALVARVRRTVAAAEAEGRPWQHVLDAVRTQGGAIWAELSDHERRRIVRRLRPFWDVHRFRIAPQVEQVIRERRDAGRLTVIAGSPVSARAEPDGISVSVRLRGGEAREETFDAIALATGPAHRRLVDSDPLISGLARQGLVRLDDVGLGLAADERSRAIGANDEPSPGLWIAGPLARGAFGELMGLPEVSRHGEFVAREIVRATAREAEFELTPAVA